MGLTAQGAGKAQWAQRPAEKPGAILTRVRVPGPARDLLPESAFSADSVTVSYSPHAQSHASTSVYMLKIPNADSKNVVWTQENTTDTDRNG